MKKRWSKPELVVLVRNQPEEAVLVTCKDVVSNVSGYSNNRTICYENCGACNSQAAS